MISVKGKEKQFYLSILSDFLSKIDNNQAIAPGSIKFSKLHDANYFVYHGVSKIVLVPKNRGARYVLKIPIRRADKGFENWCEAEVRAYEEIENAGLEKFFAETDFFTDTGRCLAYIQERTRPLYHWSSEDDEWYEPQEDWSNLSQEMIESAEDLGICAQLIDALLEEYPSEEVESFLEFCDAEHINDLHSGNFGYSRSSGVPLIYDYSGIGDEARQQRDI